MKNELQGFENRDNDWLAQEMRREAKLSAWNVDDAKIIKEDHARIHAKERRQYHLNTEKALSNKQIESLKQASILDICFIIIFIIFILMFLF